MDIYLLLTHQEHGAEDFWGLFYPPRLSPRGNVFLLKRKSELTLSWMKSNNELYMDILTLFCVMEVVVLKNDKWD